MLLTPHFEAEEFRCSHCKRDGIQMPLVEALEDLRAIVGKPIIINSGYRCPQHPIEAAKPTPGKHSEGIAADIKVRGMSAWDLYREVLKVPQFLGIGVDAENGYVHVDIRKQFARWTYHDGKTAPWHQPPPTETVNA